MCLFSYTKYGVASARDLYDSAYSSQFYATKSKNPTDHHDSSIRIFNNLHKCNSVVQSLLLTESVGDNIDAESKHDKIVDDARKYTKGFHKYFNQQRTLLGCHPFMHPDGYRLQLPSCIRKEPIVFSPGCYENIMLHICHNHILFSCFYFMPGSRLGAHGTRILYLGQIILVFVLYQFSSMLLDSFSLDRYFVLGILINLFIITPSAKIVGAVLKYLYVCPFTESANFRSKHAKYHSIVVYLGRFAIVPIMFLMGGSLILASVISSSNRIPEVLINYFVFVQFYGSFMGVAKTVLKYNSEYYFRLSLAGTVEVLCIGNLLAEIIVGEQLKANVDYACRSYKFFGFIHIEKILRRDDAIKAKWIVDDGYRTSPSAIEMLDNATSDTGDHRDVSFSNIYSDTDHSFLSTVSSSTGVTTNPLLKSSSTYS